MSNAFLRLPFTFAAQALQQDLTRCLALDWHAHFNRSDYDGSWDSIALRSASGAADDILAHPGTAYHDTPLLAACSHFRRIVHLFDCPVEGVRLLRLAPGSTINEHRDRHCGYSDGVLRVHVPVTTNPQVHFVVDDTQIPMEPGECWYVDVSLPHRVHNAGATERVHLVIDALRDAWSDRLFRAAGYDFAAERRAQRLPDSQREQVIQELARRDDAVSRQLIAQLQQQAAEPD